LLPGLIGGGLLGGTLGLLEGVVLACWGMAGGDSSSGPPPRAVDNVLTTVRYTASGAIFGALLLGVLFWAAGTLYAELRDGNGRVAGKPARG
jgi:hypothetical protein